MLVNRCVQSVFTLNLHCFAVTVLCTSLEEDTASRSKLNVGSLAQHIFQCDRDNTPHSTSSANIEKQFLGLFYTVVNNSLFLENRGVVCDSGFFYSYNLETVFTQNR